MVRSYSGKEYSAVGSPVGRDAHFDEKEPRGNGVHPLRGPGRRLRSLGWRWVPREEGVVPGTTRKASRTLRFPPTDVPTRSPEERDVDGQGGPRVVAPPDAGVSSPARGVGVRVVTVVAHDEEARLLVGRHSRGGSGSDPPSLPKDILPVSSTPGLPTHPQRIRVGSSSTVRSPSFRGTSVEVRGSISPDPGHPRVRLRSL